MNRGVAVLWSVVVLACGSDPEADKTPEDPNTLRFHFDAEVQAGEETTRCAFIQMPKDGGELKVGSIDHDYTAGSHHFLVYRTGLSELPEGATTELEHCDESGWMSLVRGVAYAAQEPQGSFSLPHGVAQTFAPEEVLLVQSHYLNTTSAPLTAAISLRMHRVESAQAGTEAGVLFYFNPAIYVKPAAEGSAELECPIDADVSLAFAASHMHKRGVGFLAESTDAAAAAQLGALYETTEWAEPIPRVFSAEEPALLPGGSSIRYRCDYKNTSTNAVVVGPSADTDEMCMFVAMYWPRGSEDQEFCRSGVASTTGTASGLETLNCITGCSGEASCRGQCMMDACPSVPMKLAPFAQCVQDRCEVCSAGQSPDCVACVTGSCGEAYTALAEANCD